MGVLGAFFRRVKYSTNPVEICEKGVIVIWYLCDCGEQNPTEFARICRQSLSARALEDAFVPTYDRMKRYQGQWHVEQGIAFPDIIFLESRDPDTLEQELHDKCPDSRMIRLSSEQKGLFTQLFGAEKHMSLSKGHIREGRTHVTQGPLQGKEALIRKIDRHKRLARLEVPAGEGTQTLYVGLEIISKS